MNLKELKDLIKLLRTQGVLQYQTPELSLVLSEQAPASNYKRKQEAEEGAEEPVAEVSWDDLTPEEQLFYSAIPTTPVPEN